MAKNMDDEIGFDEVDAEETSSIPGEVSPLKEHADLIRWAKARYLDVDPRMGAAEPIAKRMARALTRQLISDGEYVSRRFLEGATAQDLTYTIEDARSVAERLRALKPQV